MTGVVHRDLAIELLRGAIEPASARARELGVTGPLPNGFDAWFARSVNRDPLARFRDGGEASRWLGSVLDAPADRAGLVVERPGWLVLALIAGLTATAYALSRILHP